MTVNEPDTHNLTHAVMCVKRGHRMASENLATLIAKLDDYVSDMRDDDEWDSLCHQTLVDEADCLALSLDDEFSEGFVAGVLAVTRRQDKRFTEWTDEIITGVLAADECPVIPLP